jgi:hypothetical protein
MPCLGLKISLGTQSAGLLVSAVVAVEGAPTVMISAAALAAMVVQFAGLFATTVLLASCLDAAGRHADADSLRRELDALKREVERLPH